MPHGFPHRLEKGKSRSTRLPTEGGIDRKPGSIHSHRTTVDPNLLQNSLTMNAWAKRLEGKIVVDVTLYNDKTGHHVPSDCLPLEAPYPGGEGDGFRWKATPAGERFRFASLVRNGGRKRRERRRWRGVRTIPEKPEDRFARLCLEPRQEVSWRTPRQDLRQAPAGVADQCLSYGLLLEAHHPRERQPACRLRAGHLRLFLLSRRSRRDHRDEHPPLPPRFIQPMDQKKRAMPDIVMARNVPVLRQEC